MNRIINQTMTLSSPNLMTRMGDSKLSCFIGYNVKTQSVSAHVINSKGRMNDNVRNSLERSLKENADVWTELSKH